MATLIEKFCTVSREADGLQRQLEKERQLGPQVVKVIGQKDGFTVVRRNVTKQAFLEEALKARQDEADSLFEGLSEVEKANAAAFWEAYDNARQDAATLAAYRNKACA